jgi:hypothetical protein
MSDLCDDLIWGAEAIAAEINQKPRQIYYQVKNGLLPVGQVGDKLVASRKALKQHFEMIISGKAPPV